MDAVTEHDQHDDDHDSVSITIDPFSPLDVITRLIYLRRSLDIIEPRPFIVTSA